MRKYISGCLIIISLLFSTASAKLDKDEVKVARYLAELELLDNSKIELMMKMYVAGYKYDLGYSLIAVAWKESYFGNYLINLSDGAHGSFGLYHIRVDIAAARNKLKTDWEISRYAEKLISDFNISTSEAITNLLYWRDYFKDSDTPFQNMFSGYNGGGKGNQIAKSINYGEDALLRIKAIQRFFKKNGIISRLKKQGLIK